MDFVELLKRLNRDLYDTCDRAALSRLARALEKHRSMRALLTTKDPLLAAFPLVHLQKLSRAYIQYEAWRKAFRETRRTLAQSRLTLPDTSLQNTAWPHELHALERVARMCQRSGYPHLAAWTQAVDAHLALWNACVSLAVQRSLATCSFINPSHPDAAQFEGACFAKEPLSEVRNYTWLAARRGERAGVLIIDLVLPHDDLLTQARAAMPALGLSAQGRTEQAILAELVMDDLRATVRHQMDQVAMDAAIETAQRAYMSLFETPPLLADKVLALYVGGTTRPVGCALLSDKGKLLAHDEWPASADGHAALSQCFAAHEPQAVVLPVNAVDGERLRALNDAVADAGDVPVVRVLPAAVREARDLIDMPVSAAVKSAVVLGRRAMFPKREWPKVSAESLGLGEYSADLDPAALGDALDEALLLSTLGLKHAEAPSPGAAARSYPASRTAHLRSKRLNPMVRTMRDLKPGMMVDGVITNLTRFGAFVNIGLSTEAMIHISQLAVEFVEEPSQVVRVGQSVNARVLDVIPEKNRIALSLIPASALPTRPERGGFRSQAADLARADSFFSPRPPSSGGEGAEETPSRDVSGRTDEGRGMGSGPTPSRDREQKKSRSEALADLHALFKK